MGRPTRTAVIPPLLLAALGIVPPCSAQTSLTEHTVRLDEGSPRPAASIADAAWLTGRWTGEGLGAVVEEVWLPPAGGAMVGAFRLVRDGAVDFYEIVTLGEDDGSLKLSLRHYSPDLTPWEGEIEPVDFPLVRRTEDTLWFDGLTIRRMGEDRMRIWVALRSREGDSSEALFEYRRQEGR